MELLKEKLQKQLTINSKNKNIFLRNSELSYTPNDLSSKTASYTILNNSYKISNLNQLFKALKKNNNIMDSKKYLIIKPIITHRSSQKKFENNIHSCKEGIFNTLNDDNFNKSKLSSPRNFSLKKLNSIKKYISSLDKDKNKYKRDEIKPSVYYPSLKNIPKDVLIKNSCFEKYYDKNILFSKLGELNYRNQISDLGKKFIKYHNILNLKKSFDKNKIQFVEKTDTYKILSRVKFRFKSPSDRSKLKYMAENFNTIYSINKY